MEKLFKLSQRGTDVKTEVIAGLTTFMTMAYVLAVQPAAICGGDAAVVDVNGFFAARHGEDGRANRNIIGIF